MRGGRNGIMRYDFVGTIKASREVGCTWINLLDLNRWNTLVNMDLGMVGYSVVLEFGLYEVLGFRGVIVLIIDLSMV